MEALRSHPPVTAAQRRRNYHRGLEHRGRGDQVKGCKGGMPARIQHLAENDSPFVALRNGPIPRSKEQNDEFIQSWLQETQARHAHPPEADYEKRRLRLVERPRSKTVADRHRKRSRSLSEPPPASPQAAGRVEYRFEKRARHRTRDDKYDYKPRRGTKRVSDQKLAERGTNDTAERKVQRARNEHSKYHEDSEAAASHMLRRANKLDPNASRISSSLARRVPKPHASKSKLNKSQKDDKELEELSAFFSRRGRHHEVEHEEHRFVSHESRLQEPHLPAESQLRATPNGHHCSSHGAQQSYRTESGGVPPYSSSLAPVQSRDPNNRWRNKPKSGSGWSQQYDDRLLEDESGSYHSEKVRSKGSSTDFARDTLEPHGECEPAAAATPERSSPGTARGVWRADSKDAAVQTNLASRIEKSPLKQHQRLDEIGTTWNRPFDNRSQHNNLVPFQDNTQGSPQVSISRAVLNWPIPEPSRYAPHDSLDAERRGFGEATQGRGLSGPGVIPGPRHGTSTVSGRGLSTYAQEPESLLDAAALPTEHLRKDFRHHDYKSHQIGYDGGISGTSGVENLEEFIRRIEGEAAMPHNKAEDPCARSYGRLDVLVEPLEPRSLALPQLSEFGGADDHAILSNRDWFGLLETDLSAAVPADDPAQFPQDAGFTCSTSLPMWESYPLEKKGYLSDAWQQRSMF